MRLIIALMSIVAQIIAKNPRSTETSLDFVDSFASAFAGNTMISHNHTIIPTDIKKAMICILLTIDCSIVIKSDPDFVMSNCGSDHPCITSSGLQFLKLPNGFPLSYTQPFALANTLIVEKKNIQSVMRIF